MVLSGSWSSSRCVDDTAATPLQPNQMDSLALPSCILLSVQHSTASTSLRSPSLLLHTQLASILSTPFQPPSVPHCLPRLSPADLLDNLATEPRRGRSKTKEKRRDS